MGDELSREQAQNGVNFDFEVKFDLEGQGQSPPKTIGILTKVFYTYGPNLVILAWTGDELSRGQTWWRTDGLTDGRTDAGNDNTRRPILASGKNQKFIYCRPSLMSPCVQSCQSTPVVCTNDPLLQSIFPNLMPSVN